MGDEMEMMEMVVVAKIGAPLRRTQPITGGPVCGPRWFSGTIEYESHHIEKFRPQERDGKRCILHSCVKEVRARRSDNTRRAST